MTRALLLVAAHVLAFWPVLHWYALHVRHDSDEHHELLALAAALALVVRETRARMTAGRAFAPDPRALLASTCALLLYASVEASLSDLGRALCAASIVALGVASWLSGRRTSLALGGLALLALPLVPVLQFQLGWPLRAASAWLAAPWLRVAGQQVEAVGTCLRADGRLVWVDAPCSGAHMLWTGLFVACALAAWLRLRPSRTLLALLCALPLVALANALRTAALFLLETEPSTLPPWAHDGAGLVLSALLAGALVLVVPRLEEHPCASR